MDSREIMVIIIIIFTVLLGVLFQSLDEAMGQIKELETQIKNMQMYPVDTTGREQLCFEFHELRNKYQCKN